MKYRILSITDNPSNGGHRVAVLQDLSSDQTFKCYLFNHINKMASAIGVSDDLSMLTEFSILLSEETEKEEKKRSLKEWTEGMIVSFPY